MRKKLLLFAMLCCLLVGCGGKPSHLSEEVYDTAVYVIDTVDLYLDGEATIEETDEKLEKLDVDYSPGDDDSSVALAISTLKIRVSSLELGYGNTTITEVKEARDELAKEINYKD